MTAIRWNLSNFITICWRWRKSGKLKKNKKIQINTLPEKFFHSRGQFDTAGDNGEIRILLTFFLIYEIVSYTFQKLFIFKFKVFITMYFSQTINPTYLKYAKWLTAMTMAGCFHIRRRALPVVNERGCGLWRNVSQIQISKPLSE